MDIKETTSTLESVMGAKLDLVFLGHGTHLVQLFLPCWPLTSAPMAATTLLGEGRPWLRLFCCVWKAGDSSVLGAEILIPGLQDKILGEVSKDMMLILTVCFSFSQRIQSAVIFEGISG